MSSLRAAGLQLVSGLIGSSLIVFAITTFYNDFINKPRVAIEINEDFVDSYCWSHNLECFDYGIKTTVTNLGTMPATDLLVTLRFDDAITDRQVMFSSENYTMIRNETNLLVWKLPRLASNAEFITNVTVRGSTSNGTTTTIIQDLGILGNMGSVASGVSPYDVSATYDQGSTKRTSCNTSDSECISKEVSNRFNQEMYPFLASIVIACAAGLALSIPRIYKRIKARRLRTEETKVILSTFSQVKRVHETLKKDIQSKRMFSCKTWDSIASDIKCKIFDNYYDHNNIESFHKNLKIRDALLLSNPTDNDAWKDNSEELLQLSENLLNEVNWTKYRISHFSIPIGITTLSGIAIFFALDFSLVLYLYDYVLPWEWSPEIFAVITVVRGATSLLVLRKIIKFRSMSSKSERDILKVSLSRSTITKLFVFSLVIMGAPLFFVYTFVSLTSFLFLLPAFVLLDIFRMFLLVVVASKIIARKVMHDKI